MTVKDQGPHKDASLIFSDTTGEAGQREHVREHAPVLLVAKRPGHCIGYPAIGAPSFKRTSFAVSDPIGRTLMLPVRLKPQ